MSSSSASRSRWAPASTCNTRPKATSPQTPPRTTTLTVTERRDTATSCRRGGSSRGTERSHGTAAADFLEQTSEHAQHEKLEPEGEETGDALDRELRGRAREGAHRGPRRLAQTPLYMSRHAPAMLVALSGTRTGCSTESTYAPALQGALRHPAGGNRTRTSSTRSSLSSISARLSALETWNILVSLNWQ
jgi:hypothetical protein